MPVTPSPSPSPSPSARRRSRLALATAFALAAAGYAPAVLARPDDEAARDEAAGAAEQEGPEAPEAPEAPNAAIPATPPATSPPAKPARWEQWLPETVVTPTRDERDFARTPYGVVELDLSRARSGIPRTPPEALEALPGVSNQKTGPAQSSPFVRGFTGYQTLFLVDGVRLNNSTFRAGPNQYSETVDAFLLERIELVRGPGSVLYGSDANAGTIQFFSRRPQASLPEGHLPVGGRALYRFGSAERSHSARVEGYAKAGPVGGIAGASWKEYGDLEAAELGRLDNTDYRQRDADGKIVFAPSDDLEVVAALQHTEVISAPRTHATVLAEPYRGSAVGSDLRRDFDQRRTLAYVQARAEGLGVIDEVAVTASYHRQFEDEHRIRGNGRFERNGYGVDTYGAQLRGASDTPIGRITLGAEHYHDRVQSFRDEFDADGSFRAERIQGPVGDSSRYDLFGAYVQDVIEGGEVLTAIVGARYTYAKARAGRVEDPDSGAAIRLDDSWHDVSGSVRLMAHVFEHWHPFVGVSQGFRAPSLSDLTRLDEARSGEVEVPSPDLDPERFLTFEAGIKVDFERVRLSAVWFYTVLDEVIIRRPNGQTIDGLLAVTKENAGDGWATGVECEVAVEVWPRVELFAGGFFIDGRSETFPTSAPEREREVLDRLQPPEVLGGVRWWSEDHRFFAEGAVQWVGHQRRLTTRDRADTQRIPPGGSHSYFVLGLRGSAQILDHVRLFGAVENLADKAYRVHGSGLNAPGTNAIVGIEVSY